MKTLFLLILFKQLLFSHGMSESEKLTILEGGNLEYISIGITHMLAGYDHLLFVFGIIFFLKTFKEIVKYITAFTIGHSITLIFATFNSISINYYLIDAVIGLSVCYIAFVNIDGFKRFFNSTAPNMLLMITIFGLIHGFGLSTRLQELPLNEEYLLMNIISFNIGIEIGQIIALTFMLFILTFFRKMTNFHVFKNIVNSILLLCGLYFFSFQIFEYIKNKPVENKKWQDSITIKIPPKGELEYKIWVEKNDSFEYKWSSSGEKLYFDFHGEPANDTTGYFKSYKEDTLNFSEGSLVVPFFGTHGWYWKNNSNNEVIILLYLKGNYKKGYK